MRGGDALACSSRLSHLMPMDGCMFFLVGVARELFPVGQNKLITDSIKLILSFLPP
jgi:hypothetical protein